jgi:hypothetical protein
LTNVLKTSLLLAPFPSFGTPSLATMAAPVSLNGYGDNVFRGAIAAPYLSRHGLAPNTLESIEWTTNGNADKVRISIFTDSLEQQASYPFTYRLPVLSLIGLRIVELLSSATGSNLLVLLVFVTDKLVKSKSK